MTKEQLYCLRTRRTENEYLVAICDAHLIGATICDDNIELFVSEHFFGREVISKEKCLKEMYKASNLNLIGKSIVETAIEEHMINEHSVMWINCPKHGKVGHAILLR